LYDPVAKRMRTAYVFVATLDTAVINMPNWYLTRRRRPGSPCTNGIRVLGRGAAAGDSGQPESGVLKVLVHDPILGEAYRRMALHYGFLISPNIPYTPRHKGKVESGVHYVKRTSWQARNSWISILAMYICVSGS